MGQALAHISCVPGINGVPFNTLEYVTVMTGDYGGDGLQTGGGKWQNTATETEKGRECKGGRKSDEKAIRMDISTNVTPVCQKIIYM